jgi:hypothetical protein
MLKCNGAATVERKLRKEKELGVEAIQTQVPKKVRARAWQENLP